ncbi:MAG: hypothetical protein RJA36_9 [Pseudomonadota bacterium]|jgi:hypothetical protein
MLRDLFALSHDLATIAVAMVCLWAIVSPKVHTGILPTTGLGAIFIAALWSLDDWAPAPTVVDVMLGGIGLIGLGVVWRVYRKPRPQMRRSSDWLDATQPLTQEEQRQVVGGAK